MNKKKNNWFLIIGEKRKALFVAENNVIRNKWVNLIKLSLENNKQKKYKLSKA